MALAGENTVLEWTIKEVVMDIAAERDVSFSCDKDNEYWTALGENTSAAASKAT